MSELIRHLLTHSYEQHKLEEACSLAARTPSLGVFSAFSPVYVITIVGFCVSADYIVMQNISTQKSPTIAVYMSLTRERRFIKLIED
jgi:hypothetical protein